MAGNTQAKGSSYEPDLVQVAYQEETASPNSVLADLGSEQVGPYSNSEMALVPIDQDQRSHMAPNQSSEHSLAPDIYLVVQPPKALAA